MPSSGGSSGTPITTYGPIEPSAPLLPLDTWRAIIGLPPWHFWQFADSGPGALVPVNSKCSTLMYEYDWQGSDAAGRASLRAAIVEAEALLTDYLGFAPAPRYAIGSVPWPRAYQANLTRWRDLDATGRRVAVAAPEGYVQAMGVVRMTLLGTVAPVYSAQFNPALEDTFTLSVPTSITDPAEIGVYFVSADLPDGETTSERWRVQPVKVAINGGVATITGRKWLLARPILYEDPIAAPLDPTNPANFVTQLDVYARTTNGNGSSVDTCQATLVYETNDCGASWGLCWCAGGSTSSDPGTVGQVIARAGIRDGVLGLVTPGAAVYDGTAWSSSWCCTSSYCDPDRVTLRYLAGYPLGTDGQMAKPMQAIVARLATAEAKRRICACRDANEMLWSLQQDMTLESTQTERYAVAPEDLSNPFGTRRGHIQAWRAARDLVLRRGLSA